MSGRTLGYTERTMSPLLISLGTSIVVGAVISIALLTRPKRFYLIRHGETLLNAQHIRQGEEGALSEKGRRQADKVGRYLERFHITRIISSTYSRAQETSMIINEHLKASIVYSSILVERKNPSEIIGKRTDDPEVLRIVDKIDYAYHEDAYRFSDEENFIDLKKRARKCLALLERQTAIKTAVITHHLFLKILVAYMLYRKRLNAADFAKLTFFNVSDNAGITVCEFHPWKMFGKTRGWEIVSYNEQALEEKFISRGSF